MPNIIRFGKEARAKLFEGFDLVFKTVAPTLGASGRNVVYNKWSRVPIISNDGVKAAREVEPEDLGARQGANLIKQVSEQTNDDVGDGTTTSIILAHAILEKGFELLNDPNKKINPMQLRRQIADATKKVLEALKESATEVTTLESLIQVATISVEDAEIGKQIATAIFDAGQQGVVYVNESQEPGVSVEKVEGYQVPQGMISPYLITDTTKMETLFYNPVILITELQLQFNDDFRNFIALITQGVPAKNIPPITKDIVIFCDEIHPDVIKFAALNLYPKDPMTGQQKPPKFRMSIIKKPMQGNSLEDLAALVGGEVMTNEKGRIKYDLKSLGTAEEVIIKQKSTTIFRGGGLKKTFSEGGVVSVFDTHINNLKSQGEIETDEIAKTKLHERVARLTGGIYLINVGENIEAEDRYLKDKVEDAVAATKAAREEGIVSGGGTALFRLASMFNGSEIEGERIIGYACIAPLVQIVKNSGEDFGNIALSLSSKDSGFNALTREIESNMIEAGIIDPVKVTRKALENASGFAGLMLTTETLITTLPEKNNDVIV